MAASDISRRIYVLSARPVASEWFSVFTWFAVLENLSAVLFCSSIGASQVCTGSPTLRPERGLFPKCGSYFFRF